MILDINILTVLLDIKQTYIRNNLNDTIELEDKFSKICLILIRWRKIFRKVPMTADSEVTFKINIIFIFIFALLRNTFIYNELENVFKQCVLTIYNNLMSLFGKRTHVKLKCLK